MYYNISVSKPTALIELCYSASGATQLIEM